ncbi:MAG: DNA polymerase III subunit gamma/tau, partial [Dethiobacteria bacterium]|nr:DNA polymerase III subunit gamma/tau [Dethiobacteria bacterium]
MAYFSLYRRCRPQKFSDMTGQDHITRTLGNALSTQRLAHAYLFSGP